MSNRQARREQSRAARQPQRSSQRGPGRQSGPPPRKRSNMPDFMSPGFLAIAAALVIVLVGLIVWALLNSGGSDDDAVEALTAHGAALETLPAEYFDGQSLGAEDAPLTITAFEDFQCPFCLRYTAEDEPTIIDEYVRDGRVRLEFKHLPILGTDSFNAARASVCAADQNKFWQMQNELFLAQAEAGQLSDEELNVGRFDNDNLREHAQAAGLDLAAYDTCMADPASSDTVAEQNREATQFGFNSTPSFLLNGRPLGGTPNSLDAWRQVIEDQIEEAQATPTASASPSPTESDDAEATPAASPSPTATPGQ